MTIRYRKALEMAGLKGRIVVEFTDASAANVEVLASVIATQFKRVTESSPIKWEIVEITAVKDGKKNGE